MSNTDNISVMQLQSQKLCLYYILPAPSLLSQPPDKQAELDNTLSCLRDKGIIHTYTLTPTLEVARVHYTAGLSYSTMTVE